MTNNLQELRALIIKETREGLYVGPVTLSMVLLSLKYGKLTLDKDCFGDTYLTNYENNCCDDSCCDCGGRFEVFSWDLTKDDLDLQAPDVWDNLLELIKGE